MERIVRGLFVKVNGGQGLSIREIDMEDIGNITDLLGCEYFDVADRMIGGIKYDIFCDDEGMLKGLTCPSVLTKNGYVELVGNVFITGRDEEKGESVSLTPDEIENLIRHSGWLRCGEEKEINAPFVQID